MGSRERERYDLSNSKNKNTESLQFKSIQNHNQMIMNTHLNTQSINSVESDMFFNPKSELILGTLGTNRNVDSNSVEQRAATERAGLKQKLPPSNSREQNKKIEDSSERFGAQNQAKKVPSTAREMTSSFRGALGETKKKPQTQRQLKQQKDDNEMTVKRSQKGSKSVKENGKSKKKSSGSGGSESMKNADNWENDDNGNNNE